MPQRKTNIRHELYKKGPVVIPISRGITAQATTMIQMKNIRLKYFDLNKNKNFIPSIPTQ